jgi:hypothetical protein
MTMQHIGLRISKWLVFPIGSTPQLYRKELRKLPTTLGAFNAAHFCLPRVCYNSVHDANSH